MKIIITYLYAGDLFISVQKIVIRTICIDLAILYYIVAHLFSCSNVTCHNIRPSKTVSLVVITPLTLGKKCIVLLQYYTICVRPFNLARRSTYIDYCLRIQITTYSLLFCYKPVLILISFCYFILNYLRVFFLSHSQIINSEQIK